MLRSALVGTTGGRRESQEGLEAPLVQLTLATLLKSFLRVGPTGFGGGMAIIALMGATDRAQAKGDVTG